MDVDQIHKHCEKCFSHKCAQRLWPPDGCGMIDCEYDCGARFHACKKEEHSLLCQNERVNCLNSENGCPLVFPRWQLGRHLETCPASVVICTMEWNRWPAYCHERQSKLSFSQHQRHLRYGQLDVALAMRDQRMLNESMKVPRQTRKTLRNSLTKRFPAVPIVFKSDRTCKMDMETGTSTETSRTVSDDDSDAPWEKAKMPPGLQKSMCSKLNQVKKQISDQSLDMASDGTLANIPELNVVQNGEYQKRREHPQSHPQELELAINPCVNSDISHPMTSTNIAGIDMAAMDAETVENRRSLSMSPPAMDGNAMLPVSDSVNSDVPHIPTPPDLGLFLNELLGVDLNIESITRYQAKPRSMYTFLCLQEFRRDEYCDHFRNVHDSIQCGLNGWMEQRCPLSQYGCTHSFRRFYPKPDGIITHSSLLESFGLRTQVSLGTDQQGQEIIKSPSSELVMSVSREQTPDSLHSTHSWSSSVSKESTPEIFTSQKYNSGVLINQKHAQFVSSTNHKLKMSIFSLPFEVLRHIIRFLDGFSLNNVSLTCHLLRDVCSSILEERGIVIQQWERAREDGQCQWKVTYQRWKFSVCFSSIRDWGFADHEPLGEHLKNCPFNQRNLKTEPYQFPMGCDIVPEHVIQKLYKNAGQESAMKDSQLM